MVKEKIQIGNKSNKAIRKDTVRALGLIMTGSHERMKAIESNAALFEQWKQANWNFFCQEFGGAKNMVRFTIHRDEKTSHIHGMVVPITPDGRLSAKYYRDGIAKLKRYQDRYAKAMEPFGLERGIENRLIGKKHETTQDYYKRMNRVQRQLEQETQHINSLKPWHRNKGKKEVDGLRYKTQTLQMENKRMQR